MYFKQLLGLFWLVCLLVDRDWEIEVIDKHNARNYLEIIDGKLSFLLFLLLLLLGLFFLSFRWLLRVVVFEIV